MFRPFTLVFLLAYPCVTALAAEEPPSYIKRTREYQEIAEQYSRWLTDSGMLSPADGWELKVQGLDGISCTGLLPKDAVTALYLDGIDCGRPFPPKYILRLTFMHPEKIWHDADDGWKRLNSSFKTAHGITLDERLLFKLSHMLQTRVGDVRISMETYCKSWQSQFIEDQVRQVSGEACMMAGASTLITKEVSKSLKDTSIPSSSRPINGIISNGDEIIKFLESKYKVEGAVVKKLSSEQNYAEVIIEGLRGKVIEQQKNWERLQVSFIVSANEKGQEVRLLLDGQYAAGLNQPPISGYSDMEPTYSKALQLYAASLLASLKDHVTTGVLK